MTVTTLHRLCATSDIAAGEVIRFELPNGIAVAAFNLGGDYFVTDDLCTHGEASLADGEIEDGNIICPFHLGAFCIRTGVATAAPCLEPLRTYPVTIADDALLIDIGAA
jgi:nitrite reductase/ring-hydroxylating ferredoxin subunit